MDIVYLWREAVHFLLQNLPNLFTVSVVLGVVGAWSWGRRFTKLLEKINEAIDAAHYSELDKFYADILKIGIDKPYLRAPAPLIAATSSYYEPYPDYNHADKALRNVQYECYAFMVWNFLEAIHDRCAEANRESLRETWAPVIEAENGIHRGWFLAQVTSTKTQSDRVNGEKDAEHHADKFCTGFQIFITEHQWRKVKGKFQCWDYRAKFATPL